MSRVIININGAVDLSPILNKLNQLETIVMADFTSLNQSIIELHAAVDAERVEVLAKLDELAAVLAADAVDQDMVDQARILVDEAKAKVQGLVV